MYGHQLVADDVTVQWRAEKGGSGQNLDQATEVMVKVGYLLVLQGLVENKVHYQIQSQQMMGKQMCSLQEHRDESSKRRL